MTLVPLKKHYTGRSSIPVKAGLGDFDRVFDNLFNNALTNLAVSTPSVTDMALSLDISETDKSYDVKAELAGMEDSEVNVALSDGVLTISGEKKSESEEEGRTFHRVERRYGSFKRSLQLPQDADENKIKAKMKNGLLHIEIAKIKEQEKKAKTIKIES